MGIYPYDVYLTGYKIDPKNLVKWFSKYGLHRYNINLTPETSDFSKNLESNDLNHIKEVAKHISKIFDGIELQCKSDKEAYINFTGNKDMIEEINKEIDKEYEQMNKLENLKKEISKTEIKLSFLKDKLKNNDLEWSRRDISMLEIQYDNEYKKNEHDVTNSNYDDIVFGNPFGMKCSLKLSEKRSKNILETINNIPKAVLDNARKLYTEIENSECPKEQVFVLHECWTTY
jgi:hypothetical protein